MPSGIESVLSTYVTHGLGRIAFQTGTHRNKGDGVVEYNVAFSFSVQFSTSGARPRADLNRDRWIQSPEC